MTKTKRVALYLRVSKDESTTDNQRRQLEAVATRHGWEVVATFEDDGISGAKGRDQRAGLDALLNAVARKEFDMVAAWSVDRVGRSLQHLVEFMNELRAKGVDLFLHEQALDTSTPSGRAMFQMCGVFAEFELSMTRARINAGIARAKADPNSKVRKQKLKDGKIKQLAFGRPTNMTAAKDREAREMLANGKGIGKIARKLGVGSGTVQKIKDELNASKAA
jgi:DNA invertase Pin-like site-specific DNA recombinase